MDEPTPRPPVPHRQRLTAVACAAGLAALFGYFVIYLYHHESRDYPKHLGDFRTAYQAAQFVVQHRDIYQAGPYPDQRYIYPPLLAVLYTPYTLLPELAAAHVALVLHTAMLLASVLLVARAMLERMGGPSVEPAVAVVLAVALLAAVLGENEMRAELTMLESNALVLLMFALAFVWLDRRPACAGLCLALALNIKYLPLVFVPWLLLRRRWEFLASMAAGTVHFALLPALVLGWRENLRCLHVALSGVLGAFGAAAPPPGQISVRGIAAGLSVSIPSMLARVLGPHGVSGAGAMAVAALVGLLALGVVALLYRSSHFPLWRWPAAALQTDPPYRALLAVEWAGMIAVTLVFNPQTNLRHLVLTVFVNALAAVVLLVPRPGVTRWPALLAVVLIQLSYIMPFSHVGGPLRDFYFYYSVPGWCLLIGYLLILDRALRYIASRPQSAHPPGASNRLPSQRFSS